MRKTIKGFAIGLVVGAGCMLATSVFADTIKEYVLVQSDYPIYVNDNLYQSEVRPILNYEGHTYVPLRAVSELLDVGIKWDANQRRVDISQGIEEPLENAAFRNIEVSGSQGQYLVTGEARIFEATLQYEVSDGHFVFLKDFATASTGAPDWGTFALELNIPEEDLPTNGTLTVYLYEESAKDGSIINELPVVLEIFS